MRPMTAPARLPPLALRLVEPLFERAGLRFFPFTALPGIDPTGGSRLLRLRYALLESRGWTVRRRYPPDFDSELVEIIERVQPYTLTSIERLAGFVSSVQYVVGTGLPGAFVECGVWRGGSMMAAALELRRLGVEDRDLYLFDTFTGMSEPTDLDVADAAFAGSPVRAAASLESINEWCTIGVEEVRRNLRSTGYPEARIHLIEGKVEDTLPQHAPDEIALLRLDTDWYESTAHEMTHLYPRVCPGGIVLIDDYGHWLGARKAIDEYFGSRPPFLHRVDAGARLVVKP